nr:MAG TPA: hypothetical protein [Caudoviricetes sp.]
MENASRKTLGINLLTDNSRKFDNRGNNIDLWGQEERKYKMKAKVRDTGEIIDVKFSLHPNPAIQDTYWWSKDKQEAYHTTELDFLEDDVSGKFIDWENRRFEIAKELYVRYVDYSRTESAELDAKECVECADFLINELKKSVNKTKS